MNSPWDKHYQRNLAHTVAFSNLDIDCDDLLSHPCKTKQHSSMGITRLFELSQSNSLLVRPHLFLSAEHKDRIRRVKDILKISGRMISLCSLLSFNWSHTRTSPIPRLHSNKSSWKKTDDNGTLQDSLTFYVILHKYDQFGGIKLNWLHAFTFQANSSSSFITIELISFNFI